MIERAARALCVAQGYEPSENEIARAKDEVRAVLQAIREPSEGMIRAGFDDYPTIWTAGVTPEDRVGVWQAMVDTALSE